MVPIVLPIFLLHGFFFSRSIGVFLISNILVHVLSVEMVDGPGPSPLLHQQHISFSQKKKKKIDRILKRERERERETYK